MKEKNIKKLVNRGLGLFRRAQLLEEVVHGEPRDAVLEESSPVFGGGLLLVVPSVVELVPVLRAVGPLEVVVHVGHGVDSRIERCEQVSVGERVSPPRPLDARRDLRAGWRGHGQIIVGVMVRWSSA